MLFLQTIILILLFQTFLVCNQSFAQTIKYSMGPACKNNKVTCPNSNEIPTCIVLSPRVHLDINEKLANRYEPSCDLDSDNIYPGCIDTFLKEETGSKFIPDVVVECIEKVKCQSDENTNKLVATCSGGKTAKCLGSDNIPDCENASVCGSSSIPVCDYVWQANVGESNYQ